MIITNPVFAESCSEDNLKGSSTDFIHQSLFAGPGSTTVYVKKMLYDTFCGSSSSCTKCDKLPQVMSLESALVRAEDYKFENVYQTSVAHSSSLLEARC